MTYYQRPERLKYKLQMANLSPWDLMYRKETKRAYNQQTWITSHILRTQRHKKRYKTVTASTKKKRRRRKSIGREELLHRYITLFAVPDQCWHLNGSKVNSYSPPLIENVRYFFICWSPNFVIADYWGIDNWWYRQLVIYTKL